MGDTVIRRTLSSHYGTIQCSIPAVVLGNVTITDMSSTPHPLTWDALVDTGADRSVVPLSVCQELGLAPFYERRPSGFHPTAQRTLTPLYHVRILVSGLEPADLSVYGIDRDSVLLGRDFLQKLVFAVDGRGQTAQLGENSVLKSALL